MARLLKLTALTRQRGYFVEEKRSVGMLFVECNTIKSSAVIRPRTKSTKFTLSLGEFYVKDLYSENTTFPLLLYPRQQVSQLSPSLSLVFLPNWLGTSLITFILKAWLIHWFRESMTPRLTVTSLVIVSFFFNWRTTVAISLLPHVCVCRFSQASW